MNDFVKHLLTQLLPIAEAELKPVLRKLIAERGGALLDGQLQPGPFRTLLEKVLTDNADVIVDELYLALNAAIAAAPGV